MTTTEKIFLESRKKGLIPHSIINGCILILTNRLKPIYAESKKQLLTKIKNL